MAFGHGVTGLVIASIISLTSGLAFVICAREFSRELFASGRLKFDKVLRRNRDVLLDDGQSFVVDDALFEQLLAERSGQSGSDVREWQDRTSYLVTVGLLGIVAMAGFAAGLSHFT